MAGFFLFLVSFVLVVEGVALILVPKKFIKVAHDILSKTKEPKLLGIAPLLVGIFLILSVSASVLGWLVVLLGLALIAKAVYVFKVPVAKIKNSRWLSLSDNSYRIFGILILVLGIILFISRI
jgi:uncharacterized protein YjeT (DUF2065 family)